MYGYDAFAVGHARLVGVVLVEIDDDVAVDIVLVKDVEEIATLEELLEEDEVDVTNVCLRVSTTQPS